MITKLLRTALFFVSLIALTTVANAENASKIKGIYITQWNFENTHFLNYLIKRAKASGVDTFVVDLELLPSKQYEKNLQLLRDNDIKYVARIIMFPDGAKPEQVDNPERWQRKYRLVKQAVDWGADEIQLDYIRYSSKQKPSPENAKKIFAIIQWYKSKLPEDVPLEIDVFGVASYGESKYIGQNIKLFSQTVDAVCPMVYPSHFTPFAQHFNTPYETVYGSLSSIKKQFKSEIPIKVYAYIELSNYHYRMSHTKTLEYIKAQLRAVNEAGADGWYAWSAHNRYDNLFNVLESEKNAETPKTKTVAESD